MRTTLSMFDETIDGDQLQVGVVVESDGTEVVGTAEGSRTDRLEVVARAALNAARNASTVRRESEFVGVVTGQLDGIRFVTAVIHDQKMLEPVVGSAYLRPHEDDGKATIRAVFAALNRRFDL